MCKGDDIWMYSCVKLIIQTTKKSIIILIRPDTLGRFFEEYLFLKVKENFGAFRLSVSEFCSTPVFSKLLFSL
jgi:hypothetical protein